jgi:FMN reductase
MSTAIGLAGSLTTPSRSTALVRYVLDLLAARGWTTTMIELAHLSADGLLARQRDTGVEDALLQASRAEVLVVGTPIYRASYTGQLKAFFDLLQRDALASCVVGLIATGGIPQHGLAIDHGLRPLVASLAGLSAARSVYATDAELSAFPNGELPEPIAEQLRGLADELETRAATRLRAPETGDTNPR